MYVCRFSDYYCSLWPYLFLNAFSKCFYEDEEDINYNDILVHDNDKGNMKESYVQDG